MAVTTAEAVAVAEVVVVGRVPEEVDWLLTLWEIGAAKVTGMDLRFFPMA